MTWKESLLSNYFKVREEKKQPSFATSASGTLQDEDFRNVYDLIECIVAVEGGKARYENDKARFPLFKNAFPQNSGKVDENVIKKYMKLIYN